MTPIQPSNPNPTPKRTALVTGGSRGIGRAIALELARQGCAVAVSYRSQADAAEETVAAIRAAGGQAVSLAADVANKPQTLAMVAHVQQELGPIDILVNNAGVLHSSRLLDYREIEFDQMWAVNVKGTVHCAAAAAPGMIERG